MRREILEKNQVWLYISGAALGILCAQIFPGSLLLWEQLAWPLLIVLLYATFTCVPVSNMVGALRQKRFMTVILVGNFLIMPLVAWCLSRIGADNAPLRLGILLVLLVPCTDWFITFTHLGRGDVLHATAISPLQLVIQLTLLPVYLRIFDGATLNQPWSADALWPALAVIILPLLAAWGTQWVTTHCPHTRRFPTRMINAVGWFPIPVLTLVVFCVLAAHCEVLQREGTVFLAVIPVFLLYVFAALVVGLILQRAARLDVPSARTVTFSLATRNSFVVLPFTVALPQGWELTSVVVAQSVVELLTMILCVRLIPKLFPEPPNAK